jgi:hypothetical protein
MAHLHRDPVSQICLGLTSSHWYGIFHEVRDEQDYESQVVGAREYPIKSKSFDLRMRVSVSGEYTLFGWVDHYNLLRWDPTIPSPEPSSFGWYEYWYHLYENPAIPDPEIPWERSLGDLLWGEEWLWGDLIFCGRCLRFKPSASYETFPYEQMMLKKYNEGFQRWGEEIIDLYGNQCRRCRTKDIMVFLEHREQILEGGHSLEGRKSLGLKRKGGEPLKLTCGEALNVMRNERGHKKLESRHPLERKSLGLKREDDDSLKIAFREVLTLASNEREYNELVHRWETWEEVFWKLEI